MLMLLLCGSRASFRLIAEFARRRRSGTRLVIYGAGEAASLIMREMLADPKADYRMLGFVDDDPMRQRLRLQGYPVLGGERKLMELIDAESVDVVVIGTRHLDRERGLRIEEMCRLHDVTLLRVSFRLETLVSSA